MVVELRATQSPILFLEWLDCQRTALRRKAGRRMIALGELHRRASDPVASPQKSIITNVSS